MIPLWHDQAGSEANLPAGLLEGLTHGYGAPVTPERLFAYAYGILATPRYVERQGAQHLHTAVTPPRLTPEEHIALFRSAVEPTLQRELRLRGAANGDGSYAAELIGYVEIGA